MIKVRVIPQDNPNFVVLEGYDDAGDCPAYRLSVSCAALADGTLTLDEQVQGLMSRMAQRVERWTQAKSALSQINP
jgi:hypothetical protein